jgi:hypothetical protein
VGALSKWESAPDGFVARSVVNSAWLLLY